MKKFVSIILMSSIFFGACSSKKGGDGGVFDNKKIADIVNRSDDNIQFLDKNINSNYRGEDKKFADILMSKGFTKNESHVMVGITHINNSEISRAIKSR